MGLFFLSYSHVMLRGDMALSNSLTRALGGMGRCPYLIEVLVLSGIGCCLGVHTGFLIPNIFKGHCHYILLNRTEFSLKVK